MNGDWWAGQEQFGTPVTTDLDAALLARDPDTLTLSELADLAFGPMKIEKED